MTTAEPGLAATWPGADVDRRTVRPGGIPVSALVAEVPRPQAVIVALHGAATSSVYFDHPGHPRLSLLRTAAALGFTVVAVDRPGYGGSAGHDEDLPTHQSRTDLLFAAVDALLEDSERGRGLFLWAHSAGCQPALRMATDPRGAGVLGLELAGMGREPHWRRREALDQWRRDPSGPRPRLRVWEPPDAYPADVYGGARIGSPTPAYEMRHRETWREEIVEVAARVHVPVHITLSEHEEVWRSGPEALADLASLFTSAPRVVTAEQAGAGHNISVGHTALAYHLSVLAFVEECALGVSGPALRGATT
ncbi:alpha/beta hydrolase [Streptomyces sp. NPDC090499]|uniref:alpha/beta hydrolase n=1 Tax=Streptomyces sp. NPDC090499 TaxID=3365965 RepID=UPI003826A388